MPDPTKNPQELREEFARKIGALITNELDRAGREHIETAINRMIDNYSLDVGSLEVNIDINLDIGPMSGEDFVWPGLSPPTISFDEKD